MADLMANTSEARVYRVVVRRDPGDPRYWLAEVEGLQGAHTFARSLHALERYIREVIVLAADLPDEAEDELQLDWDIHTGDDSLDEEAADLRRQRQLIESMLSHVLKASQAMAAKLVVDHHYSIRDTAVLVAMSPARVGQLVPQDAQSREIRPKAERSTQSREIAPKAERSSGPVEYVPRARKLSPRSWSPTRGSADAA
ncbi:hypothetical protein QEZ54_04450 [Catellatospora sp. KI3]|uniref:hypothetical protein n=1 Tax=Catellatospora sp. KI3 TaxID=3041620 RepID=UPI0024830BFA|nr:hypothetical protein [Catellatospora sp. KI3]MDI1460211.1 hypothetical protein [Catellatospora sp. KI3]